MLTVIPAIANSLMIRKIYYSNLINNEDYFLCLPAGGGETHSHGFLFKS
jgi:hypothetical protein